MKEALGIVGRKKSNIFDFYETPRHATEKIINALLNDGEIKKDEKILEPCSGAGAISDVLESYGFEVKSSDIQVTPYIKGEQDVDVYDIPSNSCDVVFTNPPYNLMVQKEKNGGSLLKEFLRISRSKVVLLLNIFFLSGQERKSMLEKSGLKHVYIHSDRLTMYPYGEQPPKNGGTKMFAWFFWDKEYKGNPTISWI